MGNRRKNKSMCEKSTMLAVNFIKASSLLLAKVTLGSRAARPTPARHLPAAPAMPAAGGRARQVQVPPPIRLEEHETPSTRGYVMEPAASASNVDNTSSRIAGAGNVDRKAADYIERFRAKIQADTATSGQQIIIPPPPPNANSWPRNYY